MRVVADTGPLLHLHEADALQFLPLVGEISVTPLILAELRMNAPSLWPVTPVWLKIHNLTPTMQQQASAWQHAGLLHGGESEALALAQAIKPDWFITDDAAARLMAESLGIEVHGSIGVVLWMAAKKLVNQTQAETCLTGLEKSSLWTSSKVRSEARAALQRIFGPS
jgi:predicted nucleic acid-binding protein